MLAYEYQSTFLKLSKRQADVRFLLNSGVLLPASRVTLNTRVRYLEKINLYSQSLSGIQMFGTENTGDISTVGTCKAEEVQR